MPLYIYMLIWTVFYPVFTKLREQLNGKKFVKVSKNGLWSVDASSKEKNKKKSRTVFLLFTIFFLALLLDTILFLLFELSSLFPLKKYLLWQMLISKHCYILFPQLRDNIISTRVNWTSIDFKYSAGYNFALNCWLLFFIRGGWGWGRSPFNNVNFSVFDFQRLKEYWLKFKNFIILFLHLAFYGLNAMDKCRESL